MKLSDKILLAVLAVTLIGIGSAAYIRFFSVFPELIALEAKADRKDVERVIVGVDNVRNQLSILARDHGVSNYSYRFLLNPDETFLEQNYPVASFISNNINIVVFSDRNNTVQGQRYVNLDEERIMGMPVNKARNIAPYLPDISKASPMAPTSTSGIMMLPEGPMIYAAISIVKTSGDEPSPGSILFGRYIDNALIEEIEEATKQRFTIYPLDETAKNTFKALTLNTIYRNQNDTINWYLKDVNNNPIAGINVQLDKRSFSDNILSKPMVGAAFTMIVCWGILLIILNRTLVSPILKIGRHLIKIRHNEDYSLRLNEQRKDELGTLSRECDRLIEYIERQQKIVQRQSAELEKLSFEDGLTGLANRRRFDQQLDNFFALSKREQFPIALILCDVDDFKLYNDNYGHQKGDDVLINVGKMLKQSISRETDLAARYGGEEFALLLPYTDKKGAEAIANQLIDRVINSRIQHQYAETADHLTVSIGIAISSDDISTKDQLIHAADHALYQAKAMGKSQFCCYQPANASTNELT